MRGWIPWETHWPQPGLRVFCFFGVSIIIILRTWWRSRDEAITWSKTNRARMTILPPCKCCAAKQWHAETQPLPVHWPEGVQWYLCFWVCFWLLFPFSQMFCPLVGKKGLFCWDYTPPCEGWSSTFWLMVWNGLSSAPQLCNDLEVIFCCKLCFFLFERSCRTEDRLTRTIGLLSLNICY